MNKIRVDRLRKLAKDLQSVKTHFNIAWFPDGRGNGSVECNPLKLPTLTDILKK